MQKESRDISVMVDVNPADKIRLKEFMKQELHYYNSLVEGLGPRARTFPEQILAIHKDWENLWEALAEHGHSIKTYERAKPDAQLPETLEKHRKMLVGRDAQGRRFLDERMFNIMGVAGTSALIHPMVRKAMASLILDFYKDQCADLVKRNDDAWGDEDLYKKPISLLSTQDMVTKRHLQIPRSALNAVYWYADKEHTEVFTPYSDNPLVIRGHNLENNNHWNLLIVHQQPGVEVTQNDPWVVDIKQSTVPYMIKYVDVDQPRTGRIFSIMKRRDY